jgi:hypothetical protein
VLHRRTFDPYRVWLGIADEERLADFPVRSSERNLAQHLPLARRQRLRLWKRQRDGRQAHVQGSKTLPPWMGGDKGSFPLGATVQWPTDSGKEARIVAFGDTDFATNRLIGALYNEDLVLNAVYYRANREDEILIRRKVEDLHQPPLMPESTFAAFHSIALLIPEAILIFGLIV